MCNTFLKKCFLGLALCSLSLSASAESKDEIIARLKAELKAKDIIIAEKNSKLKSTNSQLNDLKEEVELAEIEISEEELDFDEGEHPWSSNMKRLPHTVLAPTATTIPEGDFYGRFVHNAQQSMNNPNDAFHDMLGLENDVKVGIMVGYGINDRWDVTIQRTNGRESYINKDSVLPNIEEESYDLWEIMSKYRLLDEGKHGIDLSVTGGTTYFWGRDSGNDEYSLNLGILVAKSFFEDRLRIGSGALYASLSDFETFVSDSNSENRDKTPNKRYKNAFDFNNDNFQSYGPDHTLALPLNFTLALNKNNQLFLDSILPLDGYYTDNGAGLALGYRYNTSTHVYSIYLSNTPNNSFNSAITGGAIENKLNLFGFSVSIFF